MRVVFTVLLVVSCVLPARAGERVAGGVSALVDVYRASVAAMRAHDRCPVGSASRLAHRMRLEELHAALDERSDEVARAVLAGPEGVAELAAAAARLEPGALGALEDVADRLDGRVADRARLDLVQARIQAVPLATWSAWVDAQSAHAPSAADLPLAQAVAQASLRYPGEVNGSGYAKGQVSLTFDDGPHPAHTNAMLALLGRTGIKATFFMLGQQATSLPAIARAVRDQGHVIAAHSIDHPQLTKLTLEQVEHQVGGSQKMIAAATGITTDLFRCPYGARTEAIVKIITSHNMRHILWNVDSLDWQDKDPQSIVRRVLSELNPAGRGIILFHDIHPQSVAGATLLLKNLEPRIQSGELRMITVHQALAGRGPPVVL